ncbi:MAG TPA: 5'-nucleotidase C-terminal domain-containing protein, partial [Burkholderiaceae bacterium]|nr:5'-nucleotidase C-terminal domain-containing protein [Burkholderiaceae bacterium]
ALLMPARDPRAELLGITTVFGNAAVERTTANALALRERFGIEAPVARGAARPLVRAPAGYAGLHRGRCRARAGRVPRLLYALTGYRGVRAFRMPTFRQPMAVPESMTLVRGSRHLLLAVLLAALCAAAHAARPVALRLIGINDFHGNLEPANLSLMLADPQAPQGTPLRVPAGGAAAVAGLVHTLRGGAPHSLFLSAGDLIGAAPLVSTMFRHESTIAVMNAIGLDVGAVGNHEFDAGIAELQRVARGGCAANLPDDAVSSCGLERYGGAKFPMLAANVLDARGRPVLAPYVVRRFAGIRVGIIGAVTKTTPSIVVPSGVAGLRFTDEADAVNRAARALKAQGVKAIIAVFHEGGELGTPQQRGDWNDTRCPGRSGPIFAIAQRLVPEISVIFTAHTHQGYRCIIDGRTIIQGTSYGRGVSVVDVALDPATREILPAKTRSINLPVVNDSTDAATRERLAAALPAPYAQVLRATRPDPAIAAQVARYAAIVAPKAERIVGRIGGRFARGGPVDSAAGRLIADAQLAATREPAQGGAQIAFMNPGGIRSDLDCNGTPPCAVSFGQVFTMQPFGNSLVVMTLTGAQIKTLLESQQKPHDMTVLQPSEGFTYTWQADAPAGERVRDMRLGGETLVPERDYRVTVNSFMAEGGDGFVTLTRGTARSGGGQDLEALLAYLKGPAERSPVPAPRITRLP